MHSSTVKCSCCTKWWVLFLLVSLLIHIDCVDCSPATSYGQAGNKSSCPCKTRSCHCGTSWAQDGQST